MQIYSTLTPFELALLFFLFLDNGVMMSPKRRNIVSLLFTSLCFSKSLLIKNLFPWINLSHCIFLLPIFRTLDFFEWSCVTREGQLLDEVILLQLPEYFSLLFSCAN